MQFFSRIVSRVVVGGESSLPHSLTINHLQTTSGVIFIRSMIIMRDISKARCGAGEL